MHQVLTAGESAPSTPGRTPRSSPSIYYVETAACRTFQKLSATFGHAAELGFSHAALPPVFAHRRNGYGTLAADLTRASDQWGAGDVASLLAELASSARSHGLLLFMDVVLDRLAAHAPVLKTAPSLFIDATESATLDPRRSLDARTAAIAAVAQTSDAAALGQWWGGSLQTWHDAGLAGVRLLGLDRLPSQFLPEILSSLRESAPGPALFAWTPGVVWSALSALGANVVDFVASSLPWWDWQSDWLWRELALLRRVAPVIAGPDLPGDAQIPAQNPSYVLAGRRRAAVFSALMADGWLVSAEPEHPGANRSSDLSAEIKALNELRRNVASGSTALLSGAGNPLIALLRTNTPDARRADRAVLAVINSDLRHAHRLEPGLLLPGTDGTFGSFEAALPTEGGSLDPAKPSLLAPGDAQVFTAIHAPCVSEPPLLRRSAIAAAEQPRIAIENPSPCVDGGLFAAKRIVGELINVEADVICDGHDKLAVMLRWQGPGETQWHELPMTSFGNDRWAAGLPLRSLGSTQYTIQAWRDVFATFRDELTKKHKAGVPISLELQEGAELITKAISRAEGTLRTALQAVVRDFGRSDAGAQRETLLAPGTATLMEAADARSFAVELDRPIPIQAERTGAAFASWYEVFPRSMSDDPARHGTFADMERHLPRIRDMGFDVLYFPPIHPIGHVNRKGRNNALHAGPRDPGSPYAIGSPEGGHDAILSELGSFEDFQNLRTACADHGLELALDFAIQCSPDHPWLKQHKDWFSWRPDGSIRYAENPPKKYEDIVNVDFYAPGAIPDLWMALYEVVLFWAGHGIRLFRVDNPHTKPLPFWRWMIAEVQRRYPDTIFLAEAFTRPKVMYRLAKVGFSQSYTYFTWRSTKREFTEYLTELTTTAPRDFFRPHFFVNTPDINPVFLQTSGRPGFLIRAALATTLSGLWGVYNGFELCEGRPLPGKEEYLDSEKYEIRAWDWHRPGNIVAEITQLNGIRRLNPALHAHLGITFLEATNDQILYFEKATSDRSNVVLVAISLDPKNAQEATITVPYWRFETLEAAAFDVDDLLSGQHFSWSGSAKFVRLTPDRPYALWRIRPAA